MAISDGVSAISNLAIGFGGFSPTAMDEMNASKELMEQARAFRATRVEVLNRNKERDRLRTSEQKTLDDDNGLTWKYVIVDDSFIRIISCSGSAASIVIPEAIEGLPVYGIAADAFSRNDVVEEIVCSDTIEAIGSCAFRLCKNLKRIVLPSGVADYSATWLQNCPSIEEIVLPGLLESVSSSIFENPHLKRLVIGKSAREIKSSAFEKSKLEEIIIDPENPFFETDGYAIYSTDGFVLYALARPTKKYCIKEGCKVIADKAFCGMKMLEEVAFPETIEVIVDFAFAHSGITEFVAPASLKGIEEKAFFHCRDLKNVQLNEGLTVIGASAFAESGIDALHIPATIESLGASVTAKTDVIHSGGNATLTIDPASKVLFLDGKGGLYRREEDGVHLIQLVDPEITVFHAIEGTHIVDEHAFAFNRMIEEVSFADGLEVVEESAFRVCENLVRVDLPDTVREIGDDAFFDTNLESFHIPAALESLGKNALVTKGVRRGNGVPSLREVEVGEGNKRFFVEGGMLCEWTSEDAAQLLVYLGTEPEVVVPDCVASIAEYAFGNARGISSITLGPNLQTIGTGGLSVMCWIRDIIIDLAKPVEGRTHFEFHFPRTPKSTHEISISLGGSSWVNVPDIMKHYDNCVVSCHEYNSKFQDGVSAYEQVRLVLARLEDPILLGTMPRNMYERLFKQHICDICVDIARHDDREMIDKLFDRGFLNEGNLEDVIAAVGKLQDAAMTGYLLEAKRRKFNKAAFDFDL